MRVGQCKKNLLEPAKNAREGTNWKKQVKEVAIRGKQQTGAWLYLVQRPGDINGREEQEGGNGRRKAKEEHCFISSNDREL